jgi:triacylglycerol lipase
VLPFFIFALAAAVLVAALVVVWRARPRPEVAPLENVRPVPGGIPRVTPLPVVLVHGLFGFDRIAMPGARVEYFRGIAAHLETLGCHAHAVRLAPGGSVPARARELVDAIAALPHERIDLIAHSLGGLDARYALTHLGLAKRVRSLVTVATPHRGSPIADLALSGAMGWAAKAIRAFGLPLEAVEWLTTSALERFNREVLDVPGVRYACVVGGVRNSDTRLSLPLIPAHAYLRRVAGANDGMVPVSSQYWGETLAEIEADHFAQIGWHVALRQPFDVNGLYAFVVARLGDVKPGAGTGSDRRADRRAGPA